MGAQERRRSLDQEESTEELYQRIKRELPE